MDVHERTAANRRFLAGFFDSLDEDQLQTRSLCDAWTVREVLGHLVMPTTVGLPDDVSTTDWRMVLDWVSGGVPGLVPGRRLKGLRLEATDQDWSRGDGDVLMGASEALAMAVTGRAVALAELSGPGVEVLRQRISGRG